MAWNVIGKTGSLCLMMVFLATGSAAMPTQALVDEVNLALDLAFTDGALGNPDYNNAKAAVVAANTDTDVWNAYVNAFAIANPPGLPDTDFDYCVVSQTNDNSSCDNPLPQLP